MILAYYKLINVATFLYGTNLACILMRKDYER